MCLICIPVQIAAPLLMLLSVTGARVFMRIVFIRRWGGGRGMSSRKERILDKLALLETILLQIQLLPACRSAFELIQAMNSGGTVEPSATLARTGGYFAVGMLATLAGYVIK